MFKLLYFISLLCCLSDLFQKGVLIHEIYKDGAAEKDGRLQPGDRLVSINGTELKGMSHKDALRILRSSHDKVRVRAKVQEP